MEVTITQTGSTLTASIDGEIDADNGHVLTREIGNPLPGDVDEVIVDMERLGFIDSSGISRLVDLRQTALDAGATLRLTKLAPNVRRVFEITGLLEAFGIVE